MGLTQDVEITYHRGITPNTVRYALDHGHRIGVLGLLIIDDRLFVTPAASGPVPPGVPEMALGVSGWRMAADRCARIAKNLAPCVGSHGQRFRWPE